MGKCEEVNALHVQIGAAHPVAASPAGAQRMARPFLLEARMRTLKSASQMWGSSPCWPLKSAAMRGASVGASTEMLNSPRASLSSAALTQPSPLRSSQAAQAGHCVSGRPHAPLCPGFTLSWQREASLTAAPRHPPPPGGLCPALYGPWSSLGWGVNSPSRPCFWLAAVGTYAAGSQEHRHPLLVAGIGTVLHATAWLPGCQQGVDSRLTKDGTTGCGLTAAGSGPGTRR